MIDYVNISQCPIFIGLNETEILNLLDAIHFQVKKFKKDEIVAISGETVQNLYILLSGSVKGEMIDYSGKTIKIEDVEVPKPLATAFLFGKQNKFPVTVTAQNNVNILSIPVSEFLKILQLNS